MRFSPSRSLAWRGPGFGCAIPASETSCVNGRTGPLRLVNVMDEAGAMMTGNVAVLFKWPGSDFRYGRALLFASILLLTAVAAQAQAAIHSLSEIIEGHA